MFVNFLGHWAAGATSGGTAFHHHDHGVARRLEGGEAGEPGHFILHSVALDLGGARLAADLIIGNAGGSAGPFAVQNVIAHGGPDAGEVFGTGFQAAAHLTGANGAGGLFAEGITRFEAIDQARVINSPAIGDRGHHHGQLQWGHRDLLADAEVGQPSLGPALGSGLGGLRHPARPLFGGPQLDACLFAEVEPVGGGQQPVVSGVQSQLDEVGVGGSDEGATKVVGARRCGVLDLDVPAVIEALARFGGVGFDNLHPVWVQAVLQGCQGSHDLEGGTR